MTDVLGLELSEAVRRLEREGYAVTAAEVRSRKGTDGQENRVVRQQILDDGRVSLTYALFRVETE